jgi:hypothetical protein
VKDKKKILKRPPNQKTNPAAEKEKPRRQQRQPSD